MTQEEFAQLIRNKYPKGIAHDGIPYAEMDDEELTNRVLEKHPAYKSKVETKGAVGEFVSGVKESFRERGGVIREQFKKGESSGALGTGKVGASGILGPLGQRETLRTLGAAAGIVGDVEMEALKLIAPKFVEDLVAAGGEKIAQTKAVQGFTRKYSELKEKHPEAMQDIEDVINIASVIPELKAAESAIKGTAKAGKTISRVTGEVLDTRRLRRVARASDEIDDVVGKIVQGKTRDISRAKKALSTIDTTGVKTYSELGEKIDDGIEALARKVDDKLDEAGEGMLLKPNDVIEKTKIGGRRLRDEKGKFLSKTVKQNFVEDSLDNLEELYTKIKDPVRKARIVELKAKFRSEGLTLREMNDLSREYGREFASRAFSKRSGEPLTGVNLQAFENTRKGIKRTVRELMPDNVTKMLDERMSEMFNTSRLVGRMEEKVNRLYQKVAKRGVLKRASMKLANIVDAATFGTVSGFISRMLPSNFGYKTMNSIDLERALNKYLKKFDKLLKTSNDKLLEDEVVKLVKMGASK